MSEGKPFIKCGELFDCQKAYDHTPENNNLFYEAMNEALRWHISHCEVYKNYLAESGIIDFKNNYMVEQIPPILTDIFNNHRLVSVPEKQIKFEIQPSLQNNSSNRLILDARSHKRILKIYENIFGSLGLINHNQKVNYLCLTYDSKLLNQEKSSIILPPVQNNKLTNINFYFDLLTSLTAHRSVFYAIKYNKKKSQYYFDAELVAKKLIDFSCHSEPVRIIGNYEMLIQILDWLENHNIFLKIVKDSFIFIFDNYENSIDKNATKARCRKYLDISSEKIKDIFILPEQGIPYISCKCGNFHIPIYAKTIVIDPESLLPVADTDDGLLVSITPYLSGFPAISILTNYKAKLENNCSCGLKGNSIRITKVYK